MVIRGGGRGPTKLGVIPLSDGAGDVEAVGERARRAAIFSFSLKSSGIPPLASVVMAWSDRPALRATLI
jgi:hypothetical protein